MTETTISAPEEIKAARKKAGLTQKKAGAVVHSPSYRAWQDWESGVRKMHPAIFELFLLKTGQKELEIITKTP